MNLKLIWNLIIYLSYPWITGNSLTFLADKISCVKLAGLCACHRFLHPNAFLSVLDYFQPAIPVEVHTLVYSIWKAIFLTLFRHLFCKNAFMWRLQSLHTDCLAFIEWLVLSFCHFANVFWSSHSTMLTSRSAELRHLVICYLKLLRGIITNRMHSLIFELVKLFLNGSLHAED